MSADNALTLGKRVIAIVDAAGAQAGSLVRAIFEDRECASVNDQFAARAIVPPGTSPETAQALRKLGAQVVEVNLHDDGELQEAVKDCYGMFCVTFFSDWDHLNPEDETVLASKMANAAKKVGIKHAIWSTNEDTRMNLESTRVPTIMGKYKVPQFDAKGESDHFFADKNVPTTYLVTSFYWDNFIQQGCAPKKTVDGSWVLSLPMGNKRLAGIAIEDIGRCALGIFKNPHQYIGKRVGIVGEVLTCKEIAQKMSRALGKEIHYLDVPFEEYREKQSVHGAKLLANMFLFYQDCEEQILGSRNPAESRKLNSKMMTFDDWLAKYKDLLPIGA
jgi:uncharacterized protein YbjT (DUF2867 family)